MRPAETTGEYTASNAADAEAAVAAAAAAFDGWAALPMARRAAYLTAAAAVLEARTEQVARDMTIEMGKPLREARGEAARAAQILRFAAERGVPLGRRALRAGGDRRAGLDPAAAGRRRRADHALELPVRDSRSGSSRRR